MKVEWSMGCAQLDERGLNEPDFSERDTRLVHGTNNIITGPETLDPTQQDVNQTLRSSGKRAQLDKRGLNEPDFSERDIRLVHGTNNKITGPETLNTTQRDVNQLLRSSGKSLPRREPRRALPQLCGMICRPREANDGQEEKPVARRRLLI